MITLYDKVSLQRDITNLPKWQQHAFHSFVLKMTDKDRPFPCIPAQHGFTSNHLRYGFIGDPRKPNASKKLAKLLKTYTECSKGTGKYASLIVFIETPKELAEEATVKKFEHVYWSILNQTSKLDEKEWPNHIPNDPMENTWEFCFHNESYFVYCATPAHVKRQSRHFPCMMLAITPRWVLQGIMESHKRSQKLKNLIRQRLTTYDTAPVHPSLKSYGQKENYEWQQYFLRDDETIPSKCPFSRIIKFLHKNKL
ncbi:YqcI/YcgG family protein [Bacillus sp. XF8]|uniref:YqcI/YcgG family protein n=1 Tax=Bacillus sp. XF8 TaxID=2819289 RepID=UPI001AA07331|nr:YqcI/YcgG family protein [Bacillus sp. XF8]MBO1582577.1 YqcI/YcgG family protein [Bacillus sp. XF8]